MMKPVHTFTVVPSLPPAIENLREVAYNLSWCWSHDSIALFRRLDSDLWDTCGHNPVLLLGTIEQGKLEAASRDEGFLAHLNRVDSNLKTYLGSNATWFRKIPRRSPQRLAGRLLLRRIRTHRVPVHLCRRLRHTGRRPSQVR